MSKNINRVQILLVLLSVVMTTLVCTDKVRIKNGAGMEHGLLVDGKNNSGHVNDRDRVSTSTTIDVGKLHSSSSTNEIIAFTKSRPVAIRDGVAWTTNKDIEEVTFSDKIYIPITVWIVKGPYTDKLLKAVNACAYTIGIFNDERVGIGFSQFEVINKTAMTNASSYYHFAPTANPDDWKNNVGWKDDRINIYYLETVSGSATTGRAVGFSNFIVLGDNFGDIAVVHEIGHSFSARHKGSPDFNNKCIMWPYYNISDPAKYFSEGELFRMHTNSTSALNSVYNARPGLITRSCVGNVSSDKCVDWSKRLWDDGVLLAD